MSGFVKILFHPGMMVAEGFYQAGPDRHARKP
jgi:hypothetical protein